VKIIFLIFIGLLWIIRLITIQPVEKLSINSSVYIYAPKSERK